VNIYAAIFAVLVVLYMGTLFTWKTTWIFTILFTIADIILVLVTKSMVEYAEVGIGLKLPVAIMLPVIPLFVTEQGMEVTMLGLGDFFFAGLIAVQTMKKFGKGFAVSFVIAMSISFFIFQVVVRTYGITAFPGTVIIICGWLPLVLFKSLKKMVAG